MPGPRSPRVAARCRAAGRVSRAAVPSPVGLSGCGLAVAGPSGPRSSPCSCWSSRCCPTSLPGYCPRYRPSRLAPCCCCCPSRHHTRRLVATAGAVVSASRPRSLQSYAAAWPYSMALPLPRALGGQAVRGAKPTTRQSPSSRRGARLAAQFTYPLSHYLPWLSHSTAILPALPYCPRVVVALARCA